MKQSFDGDWSHEIRCRIFHLWHHVGAPKPSNFGQFQIFGLGCLASTVTTSRSQDPERLTESQSDLYSERSAFK